MSDFNQDKPNKDKWTQEGMSHIKGWGIDADPKNDPTYPMRQRPKDDHGGYNWDRPDQQPLDTEVLHSNERPNVTAVYGTSKPPAGLSGMVRRCAFKYGEGSYGHWLLLLAADRINALEGVADDLWRGRVPNCLAEKGLKAQWQHNPDAVIKKAAVAAVVTAGVVMLLRSRKK